MTNILVSLNPAGEMLGGDMTVIKTLTQLRHSPGGMEVEVGVCVCMGWFADSPS